MPRRTTGQNEWIHQQVPFQCVSCRDGHPTDLFPNQTVVVVVLSTLKLLLLLLFLLIESMKSTDTGHGGRIRFGETCQSRFHGFVALSGSTGSLGCCGCWVVGICGGPLVVVVRTVVVFVADRGG